MKKILPVAFFATAIFSLAQTPEFKEQLIDGEVGIGYGLAVAGIVVGVASLVISVVWMTYAWK
jgi:hypothetical protein